MPANAYPPELNVYARQALLATSPKRPHMSTPPYDKVVGFSGHQELSTETRESVRTALMQALSNWRRILAITSLAAGSDQIFADCVLATGGQLMVVVPCKGYERTFS